MQKVMHNSTGFSLVLHIGLHRAGVNRKVVKGNQIIVLTEIAYGRILQ